MFLPCHHISLKRNTFSLFLHISQKHSDIAKGALTHVSLVAHTMKMFCESDAYEIAAFPVDLSLWSYLSLLSNSSFLNNIASLLQGS